MTARIGSPVRRTQGAPRFGDREIIASAAWSETRCYV